MGDENGAMEIQQVVDAFSDLAMIHDDIDTMLADQVIQYLLGQGFSDIDPEVTTKFDGKTTISFESLLDAPCIKDWIASKSL